VIALSAVDAAIFPGRLSSYNTLFCFAVVSSQALFLPQPDGTYMKATAFVLMVQCFFSVIVAFVLDLFTDGALARGGSVGLDQRYRWLSVVAQPDVAFTSFVYVAAMFTSNESLQFLTYPTQTLAKSCKLIPVRSRIEPHACIHLQVCSCCSAFLLQVLLGRVLLMGKRYSALKYLCVVLMTVGITMFQMGGKRMAAEGFGGSAWGMSLCLISLTLDGVCGPRQEMLTKKFRFTNNQQMIANNFWATLFMGVVAYFLGQLSYGFLYVMAHPGMLQLLCLLGIFSACGQVFIFFTIRTFDRCIYSQLSPPLANFLLEHIFHRLLAR
jgi:hypothetical protein